MIGTYDPLLVLLAVLLATAASFTALNLARRIQEYRGAARAFWLGGAALTLAAGVWSMHFIAMLAFRMPGMRTGYDVSRTTLSFVIAVVFTGVGFALNSQNNISTVRRTIAAGALMGSGVLAMHYIGMSAMRMHAEVAYEPRWVAVSAVIAILAATASLHLAFRERTLLEQGAAAVFMGAAISGMHFAGMRAASFHIIAPPARQEGLAPLGQSYLAVAVGIATVIILLFGLAAARIDAIFQSSVRREARVALRLKIADALRDTGEHAALDRVAELMGEHFCATRAGYGELDEAMEEFDYQVCWTDGSVPPLVGLHPARAFGEKIVGELGKGITVVVGDLMTAEISDEPRTIETARSVDTRAILVVPFVRGGRLRSIVYLNDSKPRQWHAEEIAFMEELAERTRLVIERELADRQLRELNTELEARVEERTAQLRDAQEALLQSQKMDAVGQLAAGLAHDFNNVLGAVVGSLELIVRKVEDADRVSRFANLGLQAAQRGTRLTGQLLSFSRVQAIHLKPLFVCDVIDGLSELLGSTLGPMIDLRLELNPNPVPVLADATQIEMTVLNLAINARDAMPDGGTLTIRTSVRQIVDDPDLIDGEYVELSVIDTGHGMDDTTRRRATEPFFTTKPVGKGTGLGLAQIYASVRKAGGILRLESAPGRGTTVRVLLARSDAPMLYSTDTTTSSEASGMRLLSILVVDDDEAFRQVLVRTLQDEGHSVSDVSSGAEALQYLAGCTPDLVILDFAMPDMDGAEVARRIRGQLPTQPILFVSGYADTAAIERSLAESPAILRKPFQHAELQTMLRDFANPVLGLQESGNDGLSTGSGYARSAAAAN